MAPRNRDIRYCLDRAIHRPLNRRQTPVLFQGCAVSVGWTFMATLVFISETRYKILSHRGRGVKNNALEIYL